MCEYFTFSGEGICHDHLGLAVNHRKGGFFLNQSSKITGDCKELQVTKAGNAFSIDLSVLKIDSDWFGNKDLCLKAFVYLYYLFMSDCRQGGGTLCKVTTIGEAEHDCVRLVWRDGDENPRRGAMVTYSNVNTKHDSQSHTKCFDCGILFRCRIAACQRARPIAFPGHLKLSVLLGMIIGKSVTMALT